MSFTVPELLGLPAADLNDLLACAPGETMITRAAYLGLDCAIGEHRDAVDAARPGWWVDELDGCGDSCCGGDPEPEVFSPPIGAGQDGVRSDLTPDETAPDGPDEDQGDEVMTLDDAAAIAAALARSVNTGEPFMGGTFAMYALPDGTVLVVTESAEGIQRRTIPKRIVRMALGAIGGKRGGILGRMIGG